MTLTPALPDPGAFRPRLRTLLVLLFGPLFPKTTRLWALEIGLFRGKSGQRRVNWDRRNDAVERVLLPETIDHRKWFGRLVHKKFYTLPVTSNLRTHNGVLNIVKK